MSSSPDKKPPTALILDRDGTINAMVLNAKGEQDSPYFWSQIELYPKLWEHLLPFSKAGIPILIATNQPGIAKGHFSKNDLESLHQRLIDTAKQNQVTIQEVFACIHHPIGAPGGDPKLIKDCLCRKPKPGMFLDLAKKYQIDLAGAVFIGDSTVDEQAANAAKLGRFEAVQSFISSKVPASLRRFGNSSQQSLNTVLKSLREEFSLA